MIEFNPQRTQSTQRENLAVQELLCVQRNVIYSDRLCFFSVSKRIAKK